MKTLVCVIGQLRAAELTWPAFRTHVVEALNADFATCTEDPSDDRNPFQQHATFRFTSANPPALPAEFDAIQNELQDGGSSLPDWRLVLDVPGNWLGGLEPAAQRSGAGAVLLYKKWCFLQHLRRSGLDSQYDRFVITRSDFLWLAPHPPVDLLSQAKIWIPAGEDHGGLNDRHAVVARSQLAVYLDGLTPLLTSPTSAHRAARRHGSCNVESYLDWQLRRAGLRDDVRRFAYVMALVRDPRDPPGWSPGEWDEKRRLFVKTPCEMRAAEANAAHFRDTNAWRKQVGSAPTDNHVLRRATLTAVRRWHALWSRPSRSQAVAAAGLQHCQATVGLAAEGVYFLGAPQETNLSERQKRQAWHLMPPTKVESLLPGLRSLHYVVCGKGVLGTDVNQRLLFRKLWRPPRHFLLARIRRVLWQVVCGRLFVLSILDAPLSKADRG